MGGNGAKPSLNDTAAIKTKKLRKMSGWRFSLEILGIAFLVTTRNWIRIIAERGRIPSVSVELPRANGGRGGGRGSGRSGRLVCVAKTATNNRATGSDRNGNKPDPGSVLSDARNIIIKVSGSTSRMRMFRGE